MPEREQMREQKIVVPDGMLAAAWQDIAAAMKERIFVGVIGGVAELHVARIAVEAALRWLSENPIVPTDEQWRALNEERQWPDNSNRRRWLVIEWQRRMFLAPEPEIPNEIEDLLPFPPDVVIPGDDLYRQVKAHLDNVATQAFRRGQKAGPQ